MQPPFRPPFRRKISSPLHSPSSSLDGMELPIRPSSPAISPRSQTFLISSPPSSISSKGKSIASPHSLTFRPKSPTTTSHLSSKPDVDKPLPATPRRTSSVYSQISETARIIENYGYGKHSRCDGVEWKTDKNIIPGIQEDSAPPRPTQLEILSGKRYPDESVSRSRGPKKSPFSSKSASINEVYFQVAPLFLSAPRSPTRSTRTSSSTQRPQLKKAPSSLNASLKRPVSDDVSFDLRPYDGTFGHLPRPMSPRITEVFDYSMVPPPLQVRESTLPEDSSSTRASSQTPVPPTKNKLFNALPHISSKSAIISQHYSQTRFPIKGDDEELHSRFSRSSSSDSSSWVLETSFRAQFRSYLSKKIASKNKKRKVMNTGKERHQDSSATERYQNTSNNKADSSVDMSAWRRGSQTLRRGSITLQAGISNVYEKIRKFSTSGSSSGSRKASRLAQPKRREKTLAIPTSPYQRYGPAIWEAPKKEKRKSKTKQKQPFVYLPKSYPEAKAHKKLQPQRDEQPGYLSSQRQSLPARKSPSRELQQSRRQSHEGTHRGERRGSSAFQAGATELISAFDRLTIRREKEKGERWREQLKKSIRLIGPADQFPDGRVNYVSDSSRYPPLHVESWKQEYTVVRRSVAPDIGCFYLYFGERSPFNVAQTDSSFQWL